MTKRPFLILIVLDGFGCRKETEWNAIAQAETPRFDELFRTSSWTELQASGLAVGLPEGQMGNSEVGHLNIGAGRIVDQDIVRISKATSGPELAANRVLVSACERIRREEKSIHFVGLLSDGGVHSLQKHLHGLLTVANDLAGDRDQEPSIFVHAIIDGRDTPPVSAQQYLQKLLDFTADKPRIRLATIIGRYYTMDRDKRWDRVQRGYDLLTLGVGTETKDPMATLQRFYDQKITDEFIEPISVLDRTNGAHYGRIDEGDAVVFFNFRADRMRQIVAALGDPTFDGFARAVTPKIELITMNSYREDYTYPVLFPPQQVRNNLGEVLASSGLRQLRIAETEKYAHVTFFFNGGSDAQSPGEARVLVPSPKVATYDLQPSMSVAELSDRVTSEVAAHHYDVVILNIANPDMIGHTGVMNAAVQAVQATDAAVAKILDTTALIGGVALITADHGNCELMFNTKTNQPHTAHTTNPVPLILVDPLKRWTLRKEPGALENVAPTILDILGIPQPPEMTAKSLLDHSAPSGPQS
jgi:2,3-bisphosphoglycerate-independent phosphoglycerate mutase